MSAAGHRRGTGWAFAAALSVAAAGAMLAGELPGGPGAGGEPPPTAFPDEVAAMERYRASPTQENAQALARVRAKYGAALLDLARQKKDALALEMAAEYAESATQLDSQQGTYWLLLALAYGENATSAAALAMAEDAALRACRREADNAKFRLCLAQILFRQTFYAAALDEFEKALTKEPALAEPQLVAMMTLAYVLDGLAPRGEAFLSGLAKARPQSASVLLARAVLAHEQTQGASLVALQAVAGAPHVALALREGKAASARADLQAIAQSKWAKPAEREFAQALLKHWAALQAARPPAGKGQPGTPK